MRKPIIALGLAAILLLAVTYVYAQGPGFGPRPREMAQHEHRGFGKWSSLTLEQKTKFQELHRKFDDETASLKGDILTKRLELQSLWTNPSADPKAILSKEKELRDLQNQMKDKKIQYMLEARKFLTPEQISQFGPGFGMGFGMGHGAMMEHRHKMGMGRGCGMWN